MKILFVFFITYFSLNISAIENFQIDCTSNQGHSNIIIEKQETLIRLTYNNKLGRVEFPLYNGIVTSSKIPYLKKAQSELISIDDKLILEWTDSQCTIDLINPMIISCSGEAKTTYPLKSTIKSFEFQTSLLSEKTTTFTYESYKIQFDLNPKNTHYNSAYIYDPALCKLINKDSELNK